jgi:ribokinase
MKIFISSTFIDLKDYRSAIEEVLKILQQQYVGMEYFVSIGKGPLETCLKKVEESDLVLCVVGTRYGAIAKKIGKSFTECEIRHANRLEIPVSVFLMDENHTKVLPGFVDKDPKLVSLRDKFIAWLTDRYHHMQYTDPNSLAIRVVAALAEFYIAKSNHLIHLRSIHKRIRAEKACKWDFLAISAQNVDRFYHVAEIKPDYESEVKEVFSLKPGGSGANTAIALAKLGKRTAVAGIITDDKQGDKLVQNYKENRVNINLLLTNPKNEDTAHRLQTGETIVFVSNSGRRQIALFPGINEHWGSLASARTERKRLFKTIQDAKVVHFSSFTGEEALKFQKDLLDHLGSKILSFSPGEIYSERGFDNLKPILLRTDVLFVYARELGHLIGSSDTSGRNVQAQIRTFFERMHELKRFRPLILVVKDREHEAVRDIGRSFLTLAIGARGAIQCFTSTSLHVPDDFKVKDATGAGGAIAAAVLYGLLERQELQYCVDVAFVMSALVSSVVGAQTALPNEKRLNKFLKAWRKARR